MEFHCTTIRNLIEQTSSLVKVLTSYQKFTVFSNGPCSNLHQRLLCNVVTEGQKQLLHCEDSIIYTSCNFMVHSFMTYVGLVRESCYNGVQKRFVAHSYVNFRCTSEYYIQIIPASVLVFLGYQGH